MSKTVTYTLSLLDRASAPLRTITGASAPTIDRLNKLQTQSKALQSATKDLGGSLSTLRQRMDLLRGEKELINPKNIKDIRTYNREIQSLEKQIDKLDNVGKKGGLSNYVGNLKSSLGGFINPLTIAAAGVGMIGGGAMGLDEQFAKVNTTAQLGGADYAKMQTEIVATAKKNKSDASLAPQAFEKIISQTNDVDLSMQILDSTLKGAKAGFTETSVVADALAQSLSIVGKENASASQILDTLFAAKRVGAGEFKDFANYLPGLIASADALGMKYQEVAGIFAYMTGKGQSAERASVLMNNMFSMLGRGEVVQKLSKAGINVFDNGKLRSSVDIFRDMSNVMSKMNDQQKSNFVEALGVVDKEAKSSFMVMTADVDKLSSSLKEVANSSGETDKALQFSANSVQRSKELWYSFKTMLLENGTKALPLVSFGLTVLEGTLAATATILEGATSFLGGWYTMLEDGNPLIWGLTTVLGVATTMLLAHKVQLMATAAWNGIVTMTTGVLSRAMVALNASMLATPLGLVLLGVAAIAGAMIALGSKTDKATKSFAEFNTELAKSKQETKEGFDVAMQAAQGSDTRKEAIRKLNEQYGSYLPNLLSEKASNDQLATALNAVNIELERKLLNKFRDQAREEALSKANEAKTEVLNWMLDQVDVGKQQQLATDFHASWDKMQSGQSDWAKEEQFYQQKYGVGTGLLSHLMGGFNFAGDMYSNLGGKMQDLQDAAFNLQDQNKRIDLIFNTTPVSGSNSGAGSFVNGKYVPASQTWLYSNDKSNVLSTTAPATGTVGTKDFTTLMSGLGGKSNNGSSSSNVFDLDQQIVNAKGSTAYNAVVSKLSKVKMSGLSAFSVPQISDASTTQLAVNGSDNEDYNQKQKTLNLDKFCDQIVIHIANANDKGYDKIRSEIIKVLKEVADGQYA